MTYPFPGMNPWLENPILWRDVHHRLISALAEDLGPRLRPRYFVAVETHTYVTRLNSPGPSVRYPDVMVINRGGAPVVTTVAQAEADYVTVNLPMDDIEEAYLQVRLVATGEVVTVIELLSHTNKQPGSHRDMYVDKRWEIVQASTNFVEIDLLRASPPMPYSDVAPSDYRLFIRRRDQGARARVYPFGVRQAIPTFPLPLLPDDEEPTVDLGALLRTVYDRAGYDLIIDYRQPPIPPLSEDDAAWASELVTRAEPPGAPG